MNSPLTDLNKKIDNLQSDISSDVGHRVAVIAAKPDDKEMAITNKQRATSAVLGGLLSLATSAILPRIIMRGKGLSRSLIAANTLSGAGTGYFGPDIVNMIIKEKRGDIDPAIVKEKIREYGRLSDKSPFKKEAGFLQKGLGLFSKGVAGAGTALRKGISVPKDAGKLQKTWGWGVKGTLGAGTVWAGYKGVQSMKQKPSYQRNYTTLLRNNILAGKIDPAELSPEDMRSVRTLGLK